MLAFDSRLPVHIIFCGAGQRDSKFERLMWNRAEFGPKIARDPAGRQHAIVKMEVTVTPSPAHQCSCDLYYNQDFKVMIKRLLMNPQIGYITIDSMKMFELNMHQTRADVGPVLTTYKFVHLPLAQILTFAVQDMRDHVHRVYGIDVNLKFYNRFFKPQSVDWLLYNLSALNIIKTDMIAVNRAELLEDCKTWRANVERPPPIKLPLSDNRVGYIVIFGACLRVRPNAMKRFNHSVIFGCESLYRTYIRQEVDCLAVNHSMINGRVEWNSWGSFQ